MEQLSIADHSLKAALGKHDQKRMAELAKLDDKANDLKERLNELNEQKYDLSRANLDASDDDLVEINAGGKIVAAKRSTLTQIKGSRFEALFSGRWDRALQRDGNGRIFLDVNPMCFEAIVDYLSDMAISSEEDPPTPPAVSDEHKYILRSYLKLFGLRSQNAKIPESNIIKDDEDVKILHGWLEEDGSDGEFSLLFSSSRDGLSNVSFHSNCDNQGCTLTVIETTDGFVLGGYSNIPWTSGSIWSAANKAFLFVLSGSDVASPYKLKLKNANDGFAVLHHSAYGPSFGSGRDLFVNGSSVNLGPSRFGRTYESGPPGKLTAPNNDNASALFAIKEMEVFQVSGPPAPATITPNATNIQQEVPRMEPVSIFSNVINEAINTKQESLLQAEMEIVQLEVSFEDDKNFVATFASGESKDVIVLNVNGTVMVTKRSTLQAVEDSVLVQQFDDSKWTEQGGADLSVKEWTPGDVSVWMKNTAGIPDFVADVFKERKISGRELLALGVGVMKQIGTGRDASLEEILRRDSVTLIEHSAYCFGKILDHLRLKHLHSLGLVEEPPLPVVRDSQKGRFEKVVKYYFPGDSAKVILG
ncbi:hypothetical protein ACHAWF_014267 [Thalassiosira exigua]